MYADLVAGLNFLVDFLLLTAANQLSGYPGGCKRTALAAFVGGIYGGLCLFPGFRFLGSFLWRAVSLVLMGAIAFGTGLSAVRRTTLFLLLSMALGGMAEAMGTGKLSRLLLACLSLWIICRLASVQNMGKSQYIPVQLHYQDKSSQLLALRDTGNALRDPVTGQQVLVVGADIARDLLGLSDEQLAKPLETLSKAAISGLRLIPYHAVGKDNGMLLAMRLQETKIGKWQGSTLVAFAPNILSRDGTYQGLTGGAV